MYPTRHTPLGRSIRRRWQSRRRCPGTISRSADGYVLRTGGIVTIGTIVSGSAVRSNHVPGIRIPVPRWWGRPSIRRLARGECAALAPGDMVTVRASRLTPATSTDSALVGNVLQCGSSAAEVEIVTDAEAVYGVTDPHRRANGTTLDLAGASGSQHVVEGPNHAFQVVIDCSDTEETLLRISPGRQRDLPVALLRDSHAPGPSQVNERRLVADAAAGDPEARRGWSRRTYQRSAASPACTGARRESAVRSCCRRASSACCAPSSALTRSSAHPSGHTLLGGCGRRCNSSSRT